MMALNSGFSHFANSGRRGSKAFETAVLYLRGKIDCIEEQICNKLLNFKDLFSVVKYFAENLREYHKVSRICRKEIGINQKLSIKLII